MEIRKIDPRDTCWEVDNPVFRVHFWWRCAPAEGVREEDMGFVSDEYEVRAADLEQVLEWAKSKSGSKTTFTLYVLMKDEQIGLGLIRLIGDDPTAI